MKKLKKYLLPLFLLGGSSLALANPVYLISQNSPLQKGTTFYVSSGTVNTFNIGQSITWPDGTVQVSSPTATSVGAIANQNTLQSGSTFYVSSGTVAGNLYASTFYVSSGTVQGQLTAGSFSLIPAGTMMMFAGSSAPTGYLLCNAAVVSQTTYANLYAAIGATYNTGGEGTGNFRLPDLQSRFPMGAGSGSGLTVRTLGAEGGAETHTLTTDELPSLSYTVNDPGHSHNIVHYSSTGGSGNYIAGASNATGGGNWSTETSTTGISISDSNGGGSHAIINPFTVVNYIIKY